MSYLIGCAETCSAVLVDPEALHDSLFEKLLRLDGALQVFPGHNYKGTPVTTLAQERAENPRLQRRERAAFVEQMRALSLEMPEHLTEALRTNRTGGKTVAQLLEEADRLRFDSAPLGTGPGATDPFGAS